MIQVSNNGERLDVFSQMPSGKRLLFALFGLIPLLAPYELMLRVQWNDYGHPAFLLAAVISAGAVVLSALFMSRVCGDTVGDARQRAGTAAFEK